MEEYRRSDIMCGVRRAKPIVPLRGHSLTIVAVSRCYNRHVAWSMSLLKPQYW